MSVSSSVSRFQSMIQRINCNGDTIQSLSSIARSLPAPQREACVSAWCEFYEVASEDQLLPLIYLANDVVQKLRRNGQDFEFKYRFVQALAGCLKTLPARYPSIVPEAFRVLDIWKNREAVDALSVNLLEQAMRGYDVFRDLQSHVSSLRSKTITTTTTNGVAPATAPDLRGTPFGFAVGSFAHLAAIAASSGLVERGAELPPLDEDVDPADFAYMKKLRTLVATMVKLQKDIKEKQHFVNRLASDAGNCTTGNQPQSQPPQEVASQVKANASSGIAAKRWLLLRKEWQCHVQLSSVCAELISLLDGRHHALVSRLGALCDSAEIMHSVTGTAVDGPRLEAPVLLTPPSPS